MHQAHALAVSAPSYQCPAIYSSSNKLTQVPTLRLLPPAFGDCHRFRYTVDSLHPCGPDARGERRGQKDA